MLLFKRCWIYFLIALAPVAFTLSESRADLTSEEIVRIGDMLTANANSKATMLQALKSLQDTYDYFQLKDEEERYLFADDLERHLQKMIKKTKEVIKMYDSLLNLLSQTLDTQDPGSLVKIEEVVGTIQALFVPLKEDLESFKKSSPVRRDRSTRSYGTF